jgi:molecular chaperone DnaK (HSP70)
MVLMDQKEIAEDETWHSVANALTAVPGYLSDGPRKSMIDVSLDAGLNVLQILTGPTAACVADRF